MRKMNLLLIEDDVKHYNLYRNEVLFQNLHTLHIVHGCNAAFHILDTKMIDVILLDLELHNADGDGVFFLQELKKKEFKYRRPFIIVITANTSIKVHSVARKFGADYIFTKSKIDYSPRMIIDFSYICFRVINKESAESPQYKNEYEIKKTITEHLEKIGITYTLAGMQYLIDAIYMAMKIDAVNLSKDIYPELARKYKKTTFSIQKAIRTAIEKAWRVTDWDVLADNYTVEVNFISSMPSNKEFITYYAN